MGDYAVTKVILKVKAEFQKDLADFIAIEKDLEWDNDETVYEEFWQKLGVNPFYYQRYPFCSGSFHAYTTSLGTSDDHDGSDFYIDNQHTTRFEDGLWFVEFSSKVGRHSEFKDHVIPLIADAWIGLYGDEYCINPDKYSHNPELIVSSNPSTQFVIENFLEEYHAEPKQEDRCGSFVW